MAKKQRAQDKGVRADGGEKDFARTPEEVAKHLGGDVRPFDVKKILGSPLPDPKRAKDFSDIRKMLEEVPSDTKEGYEVLKAGLPLAKVYADFLLILQRISNSEDQLRQSAIDGAIRTTTDFEECFRLARYNHKNNSNARENALLRCLELTTDQRKRFAVYLAAKRLDEYFSSGPYCVKAEEAAREQMVNALKNLADVKDFEQLTQSRRDKVFEEMFLRKKDEILSQQEPPTTLDEARVRYLAFHNERRKQKAKGVMEKFLSDEIKANKDNHPVLLKLYENEVYHTEELIRALLAQTKTWEYALDLFTKIYNDFEYSASRDEQSERQLSAKLYIQLASEQLIRMADNPEKLNHILSGTMRSKFGNRSFYFPNEMRTTACEKLAEMRLEEAQRSQNSLEVKEIFDHLPQAPQSTRQLILEIAVKLAAEGK